MDMNSFKESMGKVLKGCGCLSIGSFVLLLIVGIFADDEQSATHVAQILKYSMILAKINKM